MLRVLVTGFPFSGTSFLAHLLVEMGFSPGPRKNLKGPDEINRWGYWEIDRMKRYLRRMSNIGFNKAWRVEELARINQPKSDDPLGSQLLRYAWDAGVEVFKDNYIPVAYKVFLPANVKCLVIQRDSKHLYRVRGRDDEKRLGLSHDDFMRAYRLYNKFVKRMAKEIPTLVVQYEDFGRNFDGELRRIADFLGLDFETLDAKQLQRIFRPRRSKADIMKERKSRGREMPYVLIGGFSHTGTSLVCNLVHEMGFSPGIPEKMRGFGETDCTYGYWEHGVMREYTRKFLGEVHGLPRFGYVNKDPGYLNAPRGLSVNSGWRAEAREIAWDHGVEVYKDLALPYIWRMFPPESKYIIITRNIKTLWQHWEPYLDSYDQLVAGFTKYTELAAQMAAKRSCLYIQYEDFDKAFVDVVSWVARHVGVELDESEMERLQGLYRADVKTIDVHKRGKK